MRDQNGLCPCESGLRALRCCQSDSAEWPGEAALALLTPKAEEATKLFNEKKYEEAEALALAVLDAAPISASRCACCLKSAMRRSAARRRMRWGPGWPACPAMPASGPRPMAIMRNI
ncbi:hypothetical protein GT370_07830 [Acidocella sp. MX-AZ03]|uniref:hypothetical protein n=1 Tax=Acidocella sp. MX-AZ03 TaxID=2697363 RepID=UPI0022DD7061|nr:hypothetical protein [Acidocella sp. MX-AZ03]WBO60664.1 hypothetical protein GT370_07830 [Acidocella sp. MX-AZ03]